MTWQVFLNGKSLLLVSRDTPEEAIEQVREATGLEGEYAALPWTPEHLDRSTLP